MASIRNVLLAVPLLLVTSGVRAEESKPVEPGPWKFGAVVGLNMAQSAFSSNWAGGDRGSFLWVLKSDLKAERQFSHKFNLTNGLLLAYGQTARQVADPSGAGKSLWDSPEKTTDQIVAESVGRLTLGGWADPYAAFRLDSQFQDESNPAGTIHLNPIKLTESMGIARVLEKSEKRETITRFGLGFRQTFRRALVGSGPEKISFSTNDGGLEWQTTASRPILKDRVLYKGQLLVFAPVFFSQSSDLKEFDTLALAANPDRERIAGFWKVPDVNFQNTLTAQITKVVSVDLSLQLVYDKYDASTRIDTSEDLSTLIPSVDRGVRKTAQFRENLAIGWSYRLF